MTEYTADALKARCEEGFAVGPSTASRLSVTGETYVTVGWQGGTLVASIPGFVRLSPGASIHAEIDPSHLLVFDRQSGELLA